MPGWLRTLLASLGAAAITLLIAYLVITSVRPESKTAVAKARGTAISVDDAIAADRGTKVAVRGFVFLDESAGALLCSERTKGERPACAGSSMQLLGLDTSRLDLVGAPTPKGGYDAWSRSIVTLVGRADRVRLTVEDLLNT